MHAQPIYDESVNLFMIATGIGKKKNYEGLDEIGQQIKALERKFNYDEFCEDDTETKMGIKTAWGAYNKKVEERNEYIAKRKSEVQKTLTRYEKLMEMDEASRNGKLGRLESVFKAQQDRFKDVTKGNNIESLIIEEKVSQELLSFYKSLERLRKEGFDRHLRPYEAFALHSEDKTRRALEIYSSEWVSGAIELKGDKLIYYEDLENLKESESGFYIVDGDELKYGRKKEFTFESCGAGRILDIDTLPKELVECIYGVPYEDLLDIISYNSKILVMEGALVPLFMTRGAISSLRISGFKDEHQSRGVSEIPWLKYETIEDHLKQEVQNA